MIAAIDRFLAQAQRMPDALAVRDESGAALTYGALARRATRLAAGLQARLGTSETRIVALAAKNHGEHLVAMLGIFLSGHSWLPLNPRSARALNDTVVATLKPGLVLRDTACADCVSETRGSVAFSASASGCLDALAIDADGWRRPSLAPDHVMSIKLTGGTTGTPKAVAQTQSMIATVIDDLTQVFAIGPDSVNLAVAPLSHGAFHLLFPVLAQGGRHEVLASADPDTVLDTMEARAVTHTFMPPTLITKLVSTGKATPDRFPALRELIYSAAPMAPAQIEKAQAAFGPRIAVMYGQVEAPVAVSAMNADTLSSSGKLESVGQPCPSSEVRIDAGPGEDGEILVRGPLVAQSYLTGEEFPATQGWLHTGDLGRIDPAGFLYIRGRAREMIITGGFNVYPGEVERALLSVEGVEEACVFGVADDYWGERIEAAIVHSGAVSEDDLGQAVRDAIGAVAAPKTYHVLEALPRNAVGKVVRREVAAALS
ncbi:class I adenylate-forming enzyme family protein [Marinicauda sp. Alg238-R41]|uniref:class I adenylate-forming enzyme family protein n=1 Tax=Marinicauda sp. Alg238-R41 TaxID=2993447 RepID=UPI0022DFB243|nr:AMP-binding protein [Marinicauda sp. Alg238-R41]